MSRCISEQNVQLVQNLLLCFRNLLEGEEGEGEEEKGQNLVRPEMSFEREDEERRKEHDLVSYMWPKLKQVNCLGI